MPATEVDGWKRSAAGRPVSGRRGAERSRTGRAKLASMSHEEPTAPPGRSQHRIAGKHTLKSRLLDCQTVGALERLRLLEELHRILAWKHCTAVRHGWHVTLHHLKLHTAKTAKSSASSIYTVPNMKAAFQSAGKQTVFQQIPEPGMHQIRIFIAFNRHETQSCVPLRKALFRQVWVVWWRDQAQEDTRNWTAGRRARP